MVLIQKPGKFKRFFWTAPGEDLKQMTDSEDLEQSYFISENPRALILKQFINNELNLSPRNTDSKPPVHIGYMQKHALVDYCDVSERGHMKWYPKGLLIQRLLLEYARKLARDWGAFEMKNPILIRGDNNVVGELMGEFYEHDYRVDGGRGECFLRYASDPLGFPFMQQVRFNKNQSPLKVYEEASCFRNESDGAVSGLKRVRNFLMTDMHAACSSVEEAKKEFEDLTYRFGELMNAVIAKERWVLGWEGTYDFFDQNATWLKQMSDEMGVPAFFKLMPEMSHYYAIKNEFQSILEDDSTLQVSTVQWDVKDGPRFNIGYTGSDGIKHPCPVILHASSFGSIERTLCAILENIGIDAKLGLPPELPLWLSPSQIRILPVNDRNVDYALACAETLNSAFIRTEVEDRSASISKKVRLAGQDWIPYVAVVGPQEELNNTLYVTERSSGSKSPFTVSNLANLVRGKVAGMPYLPLPLAVQLDKRPIFR